MHADLSMMHWKTERPGIEIKPKPEFHSNSNLLPQLELLWQRNLERISFPLVSEDEAESAAMDVFGYEGRVRVQTHRTRERSPHLAKAKKAEALEQCGKLVCEVCKFVFTARYGDHGSGFMECHHRQPLSKIADIDGSKVTLDDLALVCANCHRMLHRKDWPSVEELRARLQ
jgi:5-methylcytosine-specific restriction enzyme A